MAKQEIKYAAIAGDPATFNELLTDFQIKNRILAKYISTQVAAIPNPKAGLVGITGQPEMVQTVIVSAYIEYVEKKQDLTTN